MDVLFDTEGRRVNVGGGIYGDGDHQLEDDVFYAELVRQVLILTADDDDSSTAIPRRNNFGYFDSMSRTAAGTRSLLCGRTDSAQTWPAVNNMSRNGGGFGGTGVFIPLTAATSRRRNGNSNGRRGSSSHKQQQGQKMMVQSKH
ncbi:unnamed protein product [Linum tenue]|uniref:Uncharacterized protein n=1 Tax=Linum tenue TaxID=586396 RepID=A0AAV0NKE5_9ROSI|nr:unnamed protein product [Linum tenue]